MKRLLRSLIIAMLFIASALPSMATHFAAGDIYYEYLSPLTYKVHLVLYRDCQIGAGGFPVNAGFGGTDNMTATSASCGQSINFTVDTTGNNTKKIYGDLCPNINNWCVDYLSIFPGYEEWHYTATLVLPMACTDWIFNYNSCCRNGAIDNLTGPLGLGFCISAGLNNVDYPTNSSAFLSYKPVPYVCVNLPKTYLNGPIDPDNDSLVFISSTPGQGAGLCTPCPWLGAISASAANPFGTNSVGGYVVNINTGTATFTPTVQGQYVIAFTCYEIDPGTNDTIGFVMRDVQLNVLNCNSAPPSSTALTQCYAPVNLIGGILQPVAPPACPDVIETCPGSTLSFDVTALSQTISNLVLTYANNATSCPGSTYTSNPIGGGSPVTGTFTWTPNGTQIGTHLLIISFVDSTCTGAQPIVLKSYAVFQIKVLPGVDAGPDLVYCIGADSIQMNVTAPPGITQWSWTDINGNTTNIGLSDINIQNPWAAPAVTTTYVVTALNPPAGMLCKIKDTVTITVVPGAVTVSAGGPSTICVNDAIVLNATATPAQVNPTILWSPPTNLSSTSILNPVASPLGTITYQLFYRDDNGCTYTRFHTVNVDGSRPLLNAAVSINPVCPNAPFQLFANVASMPCGLSVFPCNDPTSQIYKTVGTGNVQQAQYSPYYTAVPNAYKTQMLFTATELRQAGIEAGNIKSLAWFVIGKGSDTMHNVHLSLGCTAQTSLDVASGFVTGLSEVAMYPWIYTVQGWNTHPFTNNYFWDGMTNLVVQICYDKTQPSSNADILASTNTNNTQVMQQTGATNACNLNATSPLIGAVRPNTRFQVCEVGSFNFVWTPGSTLDNPTNENPQSSGIMNTTDFIITATATSNANCVSKDTIQVTVDNSNSVTAAASPQIMCGPGVTTLTATPAGTAPIYYCGEDDVPCATPFNMYNSGVSIGSSLAVTPFNGSYAGGRTQMLFTVAELNAMGITKGRIDSFALNVITKTSFSTFNMNIKMGCTALTQLNEFIASPNLKDVYQNTAYGTTVGWNMFVLQSPFLWDGLNNLVIEICFYNGQNAIIQPDAVDYSTTTNAQFYHQGSNFGGCDLPNVPTPSVPIISTARPIVNFYLCDVPVKPWKFRWDPALFLFDSTAATTTVYVDESDWYYVNSVGGNGCEVKDSVLITMSVHDVEVNPIDDTICLGDSYQAFATGFGNAPTETFLWLDENGGSVGLSCVTCTNPIITPIAAGINKFYVVRTDTYGCTDTAKTTVLVYPNPNITIINGDSVTIRYQEQVNLVATGGLVYNWAPAWSSSNPNDSSNIVSPAEPTMYYVYSLNQLGCRSWDSIFVNIDYRDKLFIPTAFSPNADGINDVFKVANLTFQSIQEFRVMNRWGQEVFSAPDNRGWNGKFKGKDQDPATFYYLIKVAFPDGPVKTYKGDVILVR